MNDSKTFRVYLNKKHLLAFRVIMLLVAIPFVTKVYYAISLGQIDAGTHIVIRGESWGYYTYLAKYGMFSIFFLWLASFGSRATNDVD
jgi:hypothetical protein